MAQFRTLSPDDVRTIMTGFGLPPELYRAQRPIAAGTINTNVRIETGRGLYFLRVNEGKSAEDVAREAAIVTHASEHGIPTPRPLSSSEGAPFVVWQGLFVSLFPWVEGRTLARHELTPAHVRTVAVALARLHAVSDRFADRRPGRYEPEEIMRRLVSVAEGPLDDRLKEAVGILEPQLRRLQGARANAPLPEGLIHGDLFVDNVLFRATGDVTLLDFEQASWGRWAYDIAVTLLAFTYGREDFEPALVRAFLDGYRSARTPTDAERAAFDNELRFAACRFAVTRITDVYLKRGDGVPTGKDFGRYLHRLAAVERHAVSGERLLAL